jgi:hypothetical protein
MTKRKQITATPIIGGIIFLLFGVWLWFRADTFSHGFGPYFGIPVLLASLLIITRRKKIWLCNGCRAFFERT